MALSRQEIETLINAVLLTRTDEVTCDDCLKELAEFAERSLAGRSISESLLAIEHHLNACPECREEYETLLAALQARGPADG